MLFILTGQVQTGKTRWLSKLVMRLDEEGIPCYGVLTPGKWKRDGVSFEKLGIEARLLPQNQIIPFAQRADLVLSDEQISEQSRALGLRWHIFEDALTAMNDHFKSLRGKAINLEATRESPCKGLLIVDELGKLELGDEPGGLTEALRLLDQGPTDLYAHTLIVVRSSLYAQAEARFGASWANVQALQPSESATETLVSMLQ